MFRAIAQSDALQLRDMAWKHKNNNYYRVLCQNQSLLCSSKSLDSLTLPELHTELVYLSHYFGSLDGMIRFSGDLGHQKDTALLFGIRTPQDPDHKHLVNHFVVKHASYLGRAYYHTRSSLAHNQPTTDIILSARELDHLVRTTVGENLQESLSQLHHQLSCLAILNPCLDSAIRGSCTRVGCYRDHVAIKLPNHPEDLVRIILQTVQTLYRLFNLPVNRDRKFVYYLQDIRRFWLRRYFDSIHPLSHRLGCATAHRGLSVQSHHILQEWISQQIFSLKPYFRETRDQYFLSDSMMLSYMAYVSNDWVMPGYIRRANRLFTFRGDLVRKNSPYSIVTDIISALDRIQGGYSRVVRGVLAVQ